MISHIKCDNTASISSLSTTPKILLFFTVFEASGSWKMITTKKGEIPEKRNSPHCLKAPCTAFNFENKG